MKIVILDRDNNIIEAETPRDRKFLEQNFSWYINDWADLYHPKGIYGDLNGVVDSKTLVYAGETIMDHIAGELKMKLNEDPTEAFKFLEKMRLKDREKLIMIVDELEKYIQDCDYSAAWDFLRGSPGKFTEWLPSKIDSIYKYAELAIFFYQKGIENYSIKWV